MKRVEYDISAERGILAGIMQFGAPALVDVSDIVDISCFSLPNQSIYKCLQKGLENSDVIDFPSLQSAANSLGLSSIFDKKQEVEFINALYRTPIKLENVRNLAKKVKKLDVARQAQNKLQQAFENMGNITGDESIDSILSIAETPLFDLSTELNNQTEEKPKKLFKNKKEYLDYLKDNPVEQVGISTGYPVYDMSIGGGIRKGSVHFIVARPKSGKTSYAKQFSLNISKRNVPVLFLDTEMQENDQFHRAIAGETNFAINDIETGKFGKMSNSQRVYDWLKRNENLPLYYKNIAGKPFEEILSIIRRWLMMEVGNDQNGQIKDCVVIYDYFKLMDENDLSKMAEYQAIGFQLTSLINFCIRYKVACHAFVQANREGVIRDASDVVSQSDRILWFAGSLCLLRKMSPEEQAENPMTGNTIIKPLDTRFGSLEDGDYIHFNFVKAKSQLIELNTHSYFVQKKKQGDIELEDSDANTTESEEV